jgi:hypothetical protein
MALCLIPFIALPAAIFLVVIGLWLRLHRETARTLALILVASAVLVFAVAQALLALSAANDVYAFSVGPDSHLSPSTIHVVESNRGAVYQEFWLRRLVDATGCFTRDSMICRLADEMDARLQVEIWYTGAWNGNQFASLCAAGLAITPLAAMIVVRRSAKNAPASP